MRELLETLNWRIAYVAYQRCRHNDQDMIVERCASCYYSWYVVWIVFFPPRMYVLKPQPVFGDRALREVIKFKRSHKGGALIQFNWSPYKKRKRHRRALSASTCTQKKSTCGHSEKVAVYKPGIELSLETEFASTLIMDFWPPDLWETKYQLFKPPSLCNFVMAAWTD